MKILYVPNEWGPGRQSGMRRALATLVDSGLIEDVKVYSLLWRIREGAGRSAAMGLLQLVREFSPDLILMQHLGSTGLDEEYFRTLRSASKFRLVYHEADPYNRWKHRLPSEAKAAGRNADVVFTVGRGAFRSNFLRSGSKDVRWCSSVFDPGRFGSSDIPTDANRPFDVVMIANRSQARTSVTGHPNAKAREVLVRLLERRFGSRFAIYGNGWTGPSARGPVTYSEQDAAIHSGWVTANWDHYANEAAYFSDRLPTTLATGSVHITTMHPGFETIFRDTGQFIRFGKSPRDVVQMIDHILSTTEKDDLIGGAHKGREYAHLHFRQDNQLVQMINYESELVDHARASALWNNDSRMLTEL